jgi:hypothetical protein
MTSSFRYRLFTLPFDSEAYEALMQQILVDDKERFQLVSENSHWTKEGEHMVAVSYLEKEESEQDLY